MNGNQWMVVNEWHNSDKLDTLHKLDAYLSRKLGNLSVMLMRDCQSPIATHWLPVTDCQPFDSRWGKIVLFFVLATSTLVDQVRERRFRGKRSVLFKSPVFLPVSSRSWKILEDLFHPQSWIKWRTLDPINYSNRNIFRPSSTSALKKFLPLLELQGYFEKTSK